MSNRFLSLFGSDKNKDSLRQEQREAILDALHFCMYADNHLALAEDLVVDNWAAKLSWEAQLSIQEYEARSIALARRAKDEVKFRGEFLSGIGTRLGDDETKALALTLCEQLVSSDASVAAAEKFVIAELKKAIGAR